MQMQQPKTVKHNFRQTLAYLLSKNSRKLYTVIFVAQNSHVVFGNHFWFNKQTAENL